VALHIAVAQASANQIIWPLAKQAGYFEKYGLNVTLDAVEGSAGATAALISGDLDASTIPGQAIAAAQAGGADLVMIAGLVNQSMLRIMVPASIRSMEDVKGKTIAITKTGASDYWTWKELMDRYGWKDNDVTFVNANSLQGQVALLQRGDAQAIAVGAPSNLIAEKSGAHQILDVTTLNIASQQNGVTALRKTLAAKRPALVNLMKATTAAIARWRTDAQFSKDFIKTYLKDDDPNDLETIYQAYLPVFAKAPYPSRDGFARVIDEVGVENPKVKGLAPDQMMDTSLVKELEDSGFIAQLYPS
jgi:NitT/TauT family transport system substrate-binding protein